MWPLVGQADCFDAPQMAIAVYEAKVLRLKWQYKGTGMDVTEQFRVYDQGYHKDFPWFQIESELLELLILLGNFWFEMALKKGLLRIRFMAVDPLSVEFASWATASVSAEKMGRASLEWSLCSFLNLSQREIW